MELKKVEKANGKISIYDYRNKPAKTKTLSINIPKDMNVEEIKKKIEECLFNKE